MKKIALLLALILTAMAASLPAEIVRKMGFDIGSGKVKMLVADVDEARGTLEKILYSDSAVVLLQEDLEKGGQKRLSDSIREELIGAIHLLQSRAAHLAPDATSAVATEVFRQAVNGSDVIQALNESTSIHARIISQEEEAALGVLTASLASGKSLDSIIAFDIGGGSFQIIAKEEERTLLYLGKMGKAIIKKWVIDEVQGRAHLNSFSPNPISLEEAHKGIILISSRLEPLSRELKRLIEEGRSVIGVGGMHPQITAALGKTTYTKSDILALLDRYIGLTDNEIDKDPITSQYMVTDLLFIYSALERFGIEEITFAKSSGNAPALLVSKKYWSDLREIAHQTSAAIGLLLHVKR